MARQILAQLILNLRDNLSGGAKKAAGALDGVGAAADRLGKKRPGLDGLASNLDKARISAAAMGKELQHAQWGTAFTRQLEKIRIAPSEFERLRSSWNKLQTDLAGGSRRANVVLGAQETWRKETLGALVAVRAETERLHNARTRLIAGTRGFVRQGLLLGGIGGGGYLAARGVRGTAIATATEQREGARDYLGGLSPSDTARIAATSLSASNKYQSVDVPTLHSLIRESALSMGSVDRAIQVSESIAQSMTVLQSLKGKDAALGQLTGFLRALDTLGKNQDPAQIRSLLDGATRAAGVQGAEYNPADVWTTAKTAKSAGFSLSDEFINSVLPALIADMGAARPGTALGSATAQLIGGRATPAAKLYQTDLGLRDKNDRFTSRDLFASNPYTWANEVLAPALAKSGVDTANEAAVVEAVNKAFSNQTVADLMGRMITQRDQIDKTRAALSRAPGLPAAEGLSGKDPFVAFESSAAQLRNAAAALADPILPAATAAMNGFASVLSRLSSSLRENPLGTYGTAAAGAGAIGLGGFATWKAIKAITGAAALEGAAVSLVGSAQALTAAATRLGLGTAAGSVGAATAAAAAGGASSTAGAASLAPAMAVLAAGGYAVYKVSSGDWPLRTEESRAAGRSLEQQNNPMGSSASQDAALKAMLAGQRAGAEKANGIRQGIEANAGQVDAASQSIMDRIRSYFSSGVSVPVRPQLGGSAISGTPAVSNPAGRANGGSVYPGGLYQINEFGNEFFQPAERGSIIPRRKMGAGGGGGASSPVSLSIHPTFNISGSADPSSIADTVMQRIESETRQALRSMFSDYGLEIA
ncbi:hypothetical protein [Microvirga antarctica]|uniref:hypothetical protein n=1 Tax=Microvirga antarctica TaxID=2819233 RepID=UPI001B303A80|nr:hypothetical protein [Microvirga antarctica]